MLIDRQTDRQTWREKYKWCLKSNMPKFFGQQTGSKDIERQKRNRTSEL